MPVRNDCAQNLPLVAEGVCDKAKTAKKEREKERKQASSKGDEAKATHHRGQAKKQRTISVSKYSLNTVIDRPLLALHPRLWVKLLGLARNNFSGSKTVVRSSDALLLES